LSLGTKPLAGRSVVRSTERVFQQEVSMNKSLAIVAAAAMLSMGSMVALAQGETIELSPEVEASLQEHVTTANVTPATVDMELAAGATVPADVTLTPVPAEIITSAPELEGHEFFVVDDRIHVVDPETRQIVTIIE
jgi:hypothetical protein